MAHSDLYSKTRLDTKTAWTASNLSRLFKEDKVKSLRQALENAGPGELAELFMQMSYAPYSGAVAGGLNDGKAGTLSRHLLAAILTPFVARRPQGGCVDLSVVQAAVIHWVDEGCLGGDLDSAAPDLMKITNLLGSVEPRIALTAPFAAPIEFSILALDHFEQPGSMGVAKVSELSNVKDH